MKKLFVIAAGALLLAACSSKSKDAQYTVTLSYADQVSDGDMIYLMDYDTSEMVDSAIVKDGKAVFSGTVEKPFMARVICEGNRLGSFIVEGGDIVVTDGEAVGTPLNEAFNEFTAATNSLEEKYYQTTDSLERVNIFDQYNALMDSVMEKNIDNPIGLRLFVDKSMLMEKEELDAALEKYPQLRDSKRVQKALDVFVRKDATSAGKMFTDFEIEYDGKTTSLSDYVGNGKYTLVDFWASWCGPCRREITGALKPLYEKYQSNPDFQILGVAVWDEPENTINAIEQMQLPWAQIINAQTIPTDLYGILGIPCIIMFGPDGTILFRDLQGAELVEAVDNALAN